MPVMSFDLQDGKPPVTFSLKSEDCDRFMAFIDECQAIKEQRREWVGLDRKEMLSIIDQQGAHKATGLPMFYRDQCLDMLRAIEDKLREKNGA